MGEPLKKKRTGLGLPIILMILILLATIGIYSYNYYLEGENQKINKRISEKVDNISEINKDANVQVFNLIKKNKKVLLKLESYSQITKFIASVAHIEDNYNLNINGFNYSNGTIKTTVETNSRSSASPYVLVAKFIKEYREDEKVDFLLPFISNISGSDTIKFNLELQIKDNLTNNNK